VIARFQRLPSLTSYAHWVRLITGVLEESMGPYYAWYPIMPVVMALAHMLHTWLVIKVMPKMELLGK
jgi:hypothetical protein